MKICPRKNYPYDACQTVCSHGSPHKEMPGCSIAGDYDSVCPRCVNVDDYEKQAEQWGVSRWIE